MLRPLRRVSGFGLRRWKSHITSNSQKIPIRDTQTPHLGGKSNLNITINSLLDTSFKNLEQYIVSNVTPINFEDVSTHSDDEFNKFEANFEDEIINYDIGSISMGLKHLSTECIDEKWGMELNREAWYTSFQHLCNEMKLKGSISQQSLLNFILRTTPQIQEELSRDNDPDFRTNAQLQIRRKSLIDLINICIKLGYIKTAAFTLASHPDINLDDVLPLIPTSFGKYILAMEVYKFQGDPGRIHGCSLGASDVLIGKFKYCYFLYMRDYNDFRSLSTDWRYWNDSIDPNDQDIKMIYRLRQIDILKTDTKLPIVEYKKFINTQLYGNKVSSYDMSILINHIFNTSEMELHALASKHVNNIDKLVKDKDSLRYQLLEYIVRSKEWELDTPMIRFLLTNLNGTNSLKPIGDYIWVSNKATQLFKLDEYKPIQAYLFEKLVNNISKEYYDEIITIHFNLLLPQRKYQLLNGSMKLFLETGDDIRFVNTILSLTNQMDYTQLIHNSLDDLFSGATASGQTPRSLDDLLKVLNLISVRSPLVKLKESSFKYGNKLLKERVSLLIKQKDWNELFQFYPKILSFTLKNKERGSHVWRLTPAILRIASLMPVEKRDYARLNEVFNLTVDYICFAPRLLYILNPKGYPSRVYIQSQLLVEDIASVLFMKSNEELLRRLIKSRVEWISNDRYDWVSKFKRNLFKFGVFLEVFIRFGIKSRHYQEIPKPGSHFQKRNCDNVLTTGCSKDHIWRLVEGISGFKWTPQEVVTGEEEEERHLGYNVTKILESIDRVRPKDKRLGMEFNHSQDDDHTQDPLDDELDDDILGHQINNEHMKPRQLNLRQDAATFNEVYQTLQNFKRRRRAKSELGGEDIWDEEVSEIKEEVNEQDEGKNEIADSMKRQLSIEHKLVMVELYSPLRMKSKLLESMIYQTPKLVDPMIEKIFNDYANKPPVLLIQSMMIGVIKTPNLKFREKIDLIKVMDKICTIVYDDKHSQMFKLQVRFTEMRIALVFLIINESNRINGGSLRTLNWAMKKIINMDNLSKYNNQLSGWNNRLSNMKETKTGFWNPTFKNWVD